MTDGRRPERLLRTAAALSWTIALAVALGFIMIVLTEGSWTRYAVPLIVLIIAVASAGLLIGVLRALPEIWMDEEVEIVEKLEEQIGDSAANMESELRLMREKYAHEPDLIAHLDSLLEQLARIDAVFEEATT